MKKLSWSLINGRKPQLSEIKETFCTVFFFGTDEVEILLKYGNNYGSNYV